MYQNTFGMVGAGATHGFNVLEDTFYADQATGAQTTCKVDFNSIGFKFRESTADANQSSSSFLFTAFAAQPIVGKNKNPQVAR